MNEPNREHQGGVKAGKQERPVASTVAALPSYRNDIGGKPEGQPPQEVKLPNVRLVASPQDLCVRKWIREITDRNGGAEEMVHEALKRVTHQHSEERLLEAQAIINELGRSGEHTKLLRSILTSDTIKSFLQKGR